MPSGQTPTLVTHRATVATPERRTHAGREYLIAPVVPIKEAVLNGELVLGEEIGRYVGSWNGIPLPLGHPTERGVPVSANTPDLDARTPGRFWNAEFDGEKLHGEIWLDIEKCQQIGGDALRALERLEAGEPVEVSTAYWRDLEPVTGGTYQGKAYHGIARNLRPDHLALLLDEVGACSWQDGCGAPRINQRGTMRTLTVNQEQAGVMVALYPPEETARAIALDASDLPDGSRAIPWEELHLTLAFFGPADEQPADQAEALRALADFAGYWPIVRGTLNGMARFRGDEQDAYVLLYDSPGLAEFCDVVREVMGYYGLSASRGHSFTPHVTLASLPADAATPGKMPEAREVAMTQIGLAWGDSVTLFDLQGEVREVETNQERTGGLWGIVRRMFQTLSGKTQEHQEDDMAGENTNTQPPVATGGGDDKPPAVNAGPETPGVQPVEPQVQEIDLESIAANAARQAVEAAFAPFGGVEGVKEAVEAYKANRDAERAELARAITANSGLAEQDLAGLGLEALRRLAGSYRPAADYSGRGGPRTNQQGEEELPMPALFGNNGTK